MRLPRAVSLFAFALFLAALPLALSSPSQAQMAVGISVRLGPPALPVYDQPICPGEGYMWTPGYWAWDDEDGYYWTPGTWVEAPEPGLLWTPGYWGWNEGQYAWNDGYWGPHVGFYGGINYGFGYGGEGFGGGEWRGGSFFYNTAVMNVNRTTITNVYVNKTVIINNESHVAFNGGQGGVQARPSARDEEYGHERHTPPVAAQTQQAQAARQNKALFASNNHGRPAVAATAKPGAFSGGGVVAARAAGGAYHAPAMSPKEARGSAPAGNRGAENRPAENRAAPTKEASHPSTKPAPKAENENRAENNTREKVGRENTSHAAAPRASESRPNATHAAKPPSEPSTRASETHRESAPRAESAHPASKPRTESAPKASEPRESAPKEAHSEPKARESEPKPSAKPSPAPRPAAAPRHESAPKPAPKESAPRASKPAPAPKPAPNKEEERK